MPQISQIDSALALFAAGADNERLSHAYLITCTVIDDGREFVEKALSTLFCTGKDKMCGTCPACLQVAAHTHPDLQWVEPVSKSRRITMKQLMALNRQIAQSSFEGGWKAAVLMGADRMTDEAANAFLKTLEEPAGKTILFLVTESVEALLPTIVSRCHRIMLSRGESTGTAEWLPDLIDIMSAPITAGGLENAIAASRLLELLKSEKEKIEEEFSEGGADNEDKEVMEARVAGAVREVRSEILRHIALWQRDLLFEVLKMDRATFHYQAEVDIIKEQAGGLTYGAAVKHLSAVEAIGRRLERNLSEISVLELGFAELTR